MSETKYKPFDGSEEAFALKIDSNANIEAVCRQYARCHQKDDQERLYYATHGELAPDSIDEEGDAVYRFANVHTIKTLWPALAQALFYDFPTIVEVEGETAKIVDEEKHARLIRSEVMRGRDDFLGSFGMNPYEVRSLLNALSSDLPFPTINRIMNPEATPASAKPKTDTETTA